MNRQQGDIRPPRFADAYLATGVRLRYAEQGDPHGRAVILLHGASDSWFSWCAVLPHLWPAHHVFALDQPSAMRITAEGQWAA